MSDAFCCDRCNELHADEPAIRLLKADHDSVTVPAWELCNNCEGVFRDEFGTTEHEEWSA